MGVAHCYTAFSVLKNVFFILVKKQILVLEYHHYSPDSKMCDFLVFPKRHLLQSAILNLQKIFGAMEKVKKNAWKYTAMAPNVQKLR
jgi:hypothetical protein